MPISLSSKEVRPSRMQSKIDMLSCPNACAKRDVAYLQFPVAEKNQIIRYLLKFRLLSRSPFTARRAARDRKSSFPQRRRVLQEFIKQHVRLPPFRGASADGKYFHEKFFFLLYAKFHICF